MMAPLPTTAHVHMTAKKILYLANPYGFSQQQRGGPLHELMRALESMGADVWEPFTRNNQIDRASAGWAYQIGQADLRDVREFAGSLHIDLEGLLEYKWTIGALATVGVLLSTLAVGTLTWWAFRLLGVDVAFVVCLM